MNTQTNHDVTPDSVLLLLAAREVVEEERFDEVLDNVRERVDEIESLHRTRELTVCSSTNYAQISVFMSILSFSSRI